jgi:hypothetical protein
MRKCQFYDDDFPTSQGGLSAQRTPTGSDHEVSTVRSAVIDGMKK